MKVVFCSSHYSALESTVDVPELKEQTDWQQQLQPPVNQAEVRLYGNLSEVMRVALNKAYEKRSISDVVMDERTSAMEALRIAKETQAMDAQLVGTFLSELARNQEPGTVLFAGDLASMDTHDVVQMYNDVGAAANTDKQIAVVVDGTPGSNQSVERSVELLQKLVQESNGRWFNSFRQLLG